MSRVGHGLAAAPRRHCPGAQRPGAQTPTMIYCWSTRVCVCTCVCQVTIRGCVRMMGDDEDGAVIC